MAVVDLLGCCGCTRIGLTAVTGGIGFGCNHPVHQLAARCGLRGPYKVVPQVYYRVVKNLSPQGESAAAAVHHPPLHVVGGHLGSIRRESRGHSSPGRVAVISWAVGRASNLSSWCAQLGGAVLHRRPTSPSSPRVVKNRYHRMRRLEDGAMCS
ncbi:uncharacterized protein [Zea mays]|uniref:uncharacterized protein n=1 Tax=Zea mays TaxID=4577 RepID=UPI00165249EB|nr:uncharacterized protein LOC118476905 [Zea mays]